MAANMNRRVCLWKFALVAVIFTSFFRTSSTTTTPIANLTTDNSTAASDSTTSSTTTTTTTTIPPSAAPVLDPNSLINQCPCDVTGNGCDVNCCCDEDCTEIEINQAFSTCLQLSKNEPDGVCFRKEIILFENSDSVVFNTTADGRVCINSTDNDYYTQPDQLQTLADFSEYEEDFASFSTQPEPVTSVIINATYYTNGDPIYTVFETQSVGKLGLPRSLVSVDCSDSNPVAYLSDETFSCVRTVKSLSTECVGSQALNAATFITGFRVVTNPQLFQEFNSTDTGIGNVYDLYNATQTVSVELDNGTGVDPIVCLDSFGNDVSCGFTSVPSPSVSLTECVNVVKEVHYRIINDGSAGIVQVLVRFVLTNISDSTAAGVRFTQSFSTVFEALGQASQKVQFSGNPGYVVGQPVLAGTLNITTDASGAATDRIEVNQDRNTYMTVVRASASGDCGISNRMPVLFGQSVQSGCMLRLTASNLTEYCTLVQETAISNLEYDSVPQATNSGFLDNNRYVGLYGNSDSAKTGDWVKILYQQRPLPSTAASPLPSSCQLSLGMQVQILYANIGALINPQPKIIAVSFFYDLPTTVQIRPSATGQFNQSVEIRTSVSFVDVSKAQDGYQADPAIYHDKVPTDFWFPFSSAPSAPVSTTLVHFLASMAVLVVFHLL